MQLLYRCTYDLSNHDQDKEIPKGEAVACVKCGAKKPFHKDCFEKHNEKEHDGKAKAKNLKEIDCNIGAVKIRNRIIKV